MCGNPIVVNRAIEALATAAKSLGKAEVFSKHYPGLGDQHLRDAQSEYMEALTRLHELLELSPQAL